MSYAPAHPSTPPPLPHRDTAFTGADLTAGSVLLAATVVVAAIAHIIRKRLA